MSRTKIIETLLLAVLMSGCAKDELDAGSTESVDTSGAISFGASADWTRGAEVETITSLALYSIFSYGEWATATDISSYFNSDYTSSIELTSEDDGATLEYSGGTRYWPTGEDQYLNFYALYPESELDVTFDSESGKPVFNYTMSTLANENDDIIFDARFDMTSQTSGGVVDLTMEHILTKLTLEVKTSGSLPEDDDYGVAGYDDYFFVNGISFTGLYDGATLNIDTDGTTSWTIVDTTKETIEVTAAQNNTLIPIFTYDDAGNATGINSSAALTGTMTSVMEEGEAIFILPQDLGVNRVVAPTVTVRIRRIYYTPADILAAAGGTPTPTGEIIYVSDPIEIPIPTATDETYTGWVKGMHNVLQFTLDLNKLGEFDTALTLISTIYPWSIVNVDVDVSPNIYIYSSDSDLTLSSTDETADMYIYTNYTSDLRLSTTKEELDGSLTTANGFTFYPYGSSTSYVPQLVSPESTDGNEVLLEWGYDADGNYVVGGTRDETTGVITGGTKLTTYDGAEGFPDMAAYFWDSNDVPGEAVACYSYGNYSGTMSDEADWLKFKITTDGGYSFYFYGALLVRGQLGLYVNSSVETDSYGVNKSDNDAVYILRLNIDQSHLMNESQDAAASGDYGYFKGSIGTELLSNGGGKITYKFGVSLQKELSNN